MGDGNFHKTKKILRLCTNSYTKKEVILLSKVIFNKFGSRIELVRNEQYILVIRSTQVPLVQKLVQEHMHPSLLYRIGILNN
jgi:hypothetical protein